MTVEASIMIINTTTIIIYDCRDINYDYKHNYNHNL